jgi:hypothetical protein
MSESSDHERTQRRMHSALESRGKRSQDHAIPAGTPSGRAGEWPGKGRRVLAVGLAATAMIVGTVTVDVMSQSWRGDTTAAASAASSAQTAPAADPVSVRFATETQIVTGKARATYPVPEVIGGASGVAARVDKALTRQVRALVKSFRAQAREPGMPADNLFLEVTADTAGTWHQYLSVRFDVIANLGGAHPSKSAAAVVIDTESGKAVSADEVFTDIDTVDRLMRPRITAAAGAGGTYPDAIAKLTMRPNEDNRGGTAPLAWYLAPEGLHWVVDQGAAAVSPLGNLEAVAPWSELRVALLPSPPAESAG